MDVNVFPGDLCKIDCRTSRITALYKAQMTTPKGHHSLFYVNNNDMIVILAKIAVENYPVFDVLVLHEKGIGWTTTDKCLKII